MNALKLLARGALLAYPAEFRAHFGQEILADLERESSLFHLVDLVRSGIAMRFDTIARDIAYAVRRLRQSPMFVAIVVLTFALGIGANVAVFSVIEDVVLRPLPFPHPGSLGIVVSHEPHGGSFPATSITDASDIRSLAGRTFSAVAAVGQHPATLTVDGRPYSVMGIDAMPAYFAMAGLRAQLGRVLDAQDAEPGVANVVISDKLWRTRFNADSNIVGRRVTIDGRASIVVGVLGAGQLLPVPQDQAVESQDFLTALPEQGPLERRGQRMEGTLVRFGSGVTLAQANAQMRTISDRLAKLDPKHDGGWTFTVDSLNADVIGPEASALWLIFAAVFGILLIACANVANILGARWSTRDREFAVRRSLGASSWRIAVQLLVETALLVSLGAACGVAIAYAALSAFSPSISSMLPYGSVSIDGFGLMYALGVVVLSTFLAALVPLFSLCGADLQSALKAAGRGGDGARKHPIRTALVAVEIALALALVIVSGLMVRNVLAILNTSLGVRTDAVYVSDQIAIPPSIAASRARASALQVLLSKLRALPGVESAAITVLYPLGNLGLEAGFPIQGRTYAPGNEPLAGAATISEDYFKAFAIPIVGGRAFNEGDRAGAEPVAIVNHAFVDTYMKGLAPLGTRVKVGVGPRSPGSWARVVGIVGNERLVDLTSPVLPIVYVPFEQFTPNFVAAVVHAPGIGSAAVGREIQAAFASAFPMHQPPQTYTMSDRVALSTAPLRIITWLVCVLGAIALLLACAGIFGVVAFSVSQRMREFGIRMALGATASDVLVDVLRRSLSVTAIGIVAGLAIAALAANALAAQLSDVSPFDPLTFVIVVTMIVASSILASLQPALRATRAQPVEALRYE